MASTRDIVILGSGSTAFAAALRAQSLGASVLMIEKSDLGGTCVNWGCIPSKTLIHDALFRHGARIGAARGMAVMEQPTDFHRLADHKSEVVTFLRRTKYLDVLHRVPGLEVVKGFARFISPRAVAVGTTVIESDKFLIATGGIPNVLDFPGVHQVDFLTSRTALLLKVFPRSLVIIGGGVIALELGQMFLRMGTQVTLLEHGPRILPPVDADVAETVRQAVEREGMELHTGVSICSLEKTGPWTVVATEMANRHREFRAERVLLATGTAPASSDIGLEKAGVETDAKGFIRVDANMRTTVPGIWAAGDVIGGMMIATAGAREGIVAVDNMLNPECGCSIDYGMVPMAIFTDPEIGLVGESEESARAAGMDVMVNSLPAAAIPKAHVTGDTAGLIKIVADAATGRLLGVQLACKRGADIINEAALAIRCRMTIDDLAATLHVYPSMAEGLRLCAQGFRRDVTKLSCCAE